MIYRIRGWQKHFENNRTKDIKNLNWVPIPNKMDGDGFSELLDHPDGASHYGAWCIIVLVASKCDPRGTLLRDTLEPHTPQSLARMSRVPAVILEAAIKRLVTIGWLEVCENPAPSCGPSAALSCLSPEQNRTEQKEEYTYTLEDCVKASEGIGMKQSDIEAFWANYAAVSWTDAAGRKITNLKAALAKWKLNQPSHGKKYGHERTRRTVEETDKMLRGEL